MNKCAFFLQAAFSGFFTILVSLNSNAQIAPAKLWDKTFGGTDGDVNTAMKPTSDGGYILGGISTSGIGKDKTQAGQGYNDYWIVKVDPNGTKVWDKTFGGSLVDALWGLQQTSDGGYVLGGWSYSGISGDKTEPNKGTAWGDYWIVKLDVSGNKIWDKTFGTATARDELLAIQQTADGGYILGGFSGGVISGDKTQAGFGDLDYWIVKLDNNGNKLWDRTFGGSNYDGFSCLQQTSDGGYILGGSSLSGISGNKSQASKGSYDMWVIKIDVNGNKIWDKAFGGTNADGIHCLQQTSDGGYILGGDSQSGMGGDKSQPNQGMNDYWVVKIDGTGNKVWDKTFGGNDFDDLKSVCQTTDGGYILGGSSNSGISGDKSEINYGDKDGWVVMLNVNGNKLWDKSFGKAGGDYIDAVQQTPDNGFIISGGETITSTDTDFRLIKLAGNPTGLNDSEATITNQLFQNQPNPFSKNTTISFNLAQPEKVELTIYNSLGQTVAIHQKKYGAGKHQVLWEELVAGKSLKAGTYFYQLSAGEFRDTKRMVLLD